MIPEAVLPSTNTCHERAVKSSDHVPVICMGHLFTQGGQTIEGDGVRDLYIGTLAHVGTDVFTTTYGGRKYGQLSVVICEIDGGRARLPIIKAILDLCNRLVPDEFNMSKIEPNKLGFFPCVIATPGGYTTKIALNSNHFIWR